MFPAQSRTNTEMNLKRKFALAAIILTAAGLATPTASAITLLSIEFKEDDQAGFDLWPTAFTGASTTANFLTPSTTQLTDTSSDLQGSPINGFILSQIPEPSSALLAALGSLGLLARRRK